MEGLEKVMEGAAIPTNEKTGASLLKRGVDILLSTPHDGALTIARLTLGGVMFPHGAQKLLGWFGGPGISGEIQVIHTYFGIPPALTVMVIIAEFFGALGLVSGLLSRLSALGIAIVMTVAIVMAHAQFGFFMNWFGTQKGEGFEYHLLILGLASIVIWKGGGAYSLDRLLSRQRNG